MPMVLLIEDEAVLREEVTEWLTFEGYEVVAVADGKAGVACATFHQPDLILCDITMPLLDGYGVLAAVHANQTTAGVPFIFITARTAHEDQRRGMELGADDYIQKPFRRLELLNAVAARLAKRQQQREEHEHEMQLLQSALVQLHSQHLLQAKLLTMLSHDFNGPLTSILLTSTLLQAHEHKLDAVTRRQHLERITASTHLLQQMLEDVLLVTQIEKGTLILQPQPVVPSQFLWRIVQVFKAIHGEKYLIELAYGTDEPLTVDPRLLRQIAMNLIANAMKYSAGGSTVKIALYHNDENVLFRVEDQGIGIPEADQPTIFDAFQRGSNVTEVTGTGLGLAIVKQAVDLYGGTIELESQVGVGTKVTVTLPNHNEFEEHF